MVLEQEHVPERKTKAERICGTRSHKSLEEIEGVEMEERRRGNIEVGST